MQNYRAAAYNRKGEHKKALADTDKVLELSGETGELRHRGVAYLKLGDWDNAIQFLSKSLVHFYDQGRNFKENSLKIRGTVYYLAMAYRHKGLIDAAIQEYSNIVPLSAEAHLGLAEAFLAKKNPQKAVTEATLSINLRPNWAEAYFVRSLGYAALNETKKAADDKQVC